MLAAGAFCLAALAAWAQGEPLFDQAKITVGQKSLQVQVARTEAAREQGLMHRQTLAPWDGMLFVFQEPQPVAFWMKDTVMPLEVAYFDEAGTLQEIRPLTPGDLTPVRSHRTDILYALELPSGDFERHGLKIGQKLTLERHP